jgi:hypothetical protein
MCGCRRLVGCMVQPCILVAVQHLLHSAFFGVVFDCQVAEMVPESDEGAAGGLRSGACYRPQHCWIATVAPPSHLAGTGAQAGRPWSGHGEVIVTGNPLIQCTNSKLAA